MLSRIYRSISRAYVKLPYGRRIFVSANAIGTIFGVVSVLTGFSTLSVTITIFNALGIVMCAVMCWLGFRTRRFTPLYIIFMILMIALVSFQQINHDGYGGSMPIIMLLLVVILLTIADARHHPLIMVLPLLAMIGLYVLESLYPEILGKYPGEAERRLDVLFAVTVSSLAAWAMVTGLRRSFEIERARLREANVRTRRSAQRTRRAQSATERATRARKNFLSTMSHEIRTPLNSIIGMAHLLQDESLKSLSQENQSAVKTIRFSAEHLLSLINDILDYSRLDSGVVEPEMRPPAVLEWLEGLLETFRVAARENQTRVELVLPPVGEMPGTIVSDAPRLTQILTNLLSNAIKFTAGGTVTLEVRTRRLTEATWDLCFIVRDTGVGIAPDRLGGIFDEFTQAESDTYREFGGTGLGLAIVRRLVDLFGGEIQAESAPGQGTSFTVDLALGVLSDEARARLDVAPTGSRAESTADSEARLAGRRALIVEDYEMNRVIAERFLKRWGVEVVTAESGHAALELTRDSDPPAIDVVLMDIQMPGIDGYETTRQMRAAGGPWATVPIIALTAASLPEEREAAFAAGMNDYVAKPFRPDDLRDARLRRL